MDPAASPGGEGTLRSGVRSDLEALRQIALSGDHQEESVLPGLEADELRRRRREAPRSRPDDARNPRALIEAVSRPVALAVEAGDEAVPRLAGHRDGHHHPGLRLHLGEPARLPGSGIRPVPVEAFDRHLDLWRQGGAGSEPPADRQGQAGRDSEGGHANRAPPQNPSASFRAAEAVLQRPAKVGGRSRFDVSLEPAPPLWLGGQATLDPRGVLGRKVAPSIGLELQVIDLLRLVLLRGRGARVLELAQLPEKRLSVFGPHRHALRSPIGGRVWRPRPLVSRRGNLSRGSGLGG